MKHFNRYEFLTELREELTSECANLFSLDVDENEIQDSLDSFVHSYIDNACIYTANCWAICYELASSDFEIEQTGETAKNIQELAYWNLYDLSYMIDVELIIEKTERTKQ